MKNIRKIGNYEIVIYNGDDLRMKEVIVDSSLAEARKTAQNMIKNTGNSFTVSRIVDNSKYNKWVVS